MPFSQGGLRFTVRHFIADWTIGTPLVVPDELAAQFPPLRAARFRAGGMFVRIGGWCLGRRTVAGITLGRTIWLARPVLWDPRLLLHELRHVQHFAAIRWFPVRYVCESLRRGYAANRFERDANAYAEAELARDRRCRSAAADR